MTVLQLIRILWAHRWAEFAMLLGVVAIAIAGSFLIPKQYTATATMFLDVRAPDRIAGTVLPGMANTGYTATQIDIIKSERVTRTVAGNLGLNRRELIRSKWFKATDGKVDFDDWIVEFLQKRLSVVPAHESNVIRIGFTGDTPAFAAEGANAFARAYRDINLELKLEPARTYASWFEQQTRLVRERLAAAQKALSDYQQRAGILPSDTRTDFESARLNEMATQLTELQGDITSSHNKLGVATAGSVADVMDSDVVTALKIDIARVEARAREAAGTLLPNHPQIVRLHEELAALKRQLAVETRLVKAAIGTSYDVDRQRERDLQRAMADQKARVLVLNKQRDELNVYKRDVESAQRAYEAVSQRAAQTRLESLGSQADVVVLSAARPPIRPSRPRLLFVVLVAACAGAMLALGLGLLLELLNRRIRSQEDLGSLQLPVLATLRPHRPDPKRRGAHRNIPSSIPLLGEEAIRE